MVNYAESWSVTTEDQKLMAVGAGAGDGTMTRDVTISITDDEGRTSVKLSVAAWVAFVARINKRLEAETTP